jgi:hypothetical protein
MERSVGGVFVLNLGLSVCFKKPSVGGGAFDAPKKT